MNQIICLDDRFSTTRNVTLEKPEIINKPEDKFETLLFLPPNEGRKGEGGLRTKGYFKKSYEGNPLISVITVVFNGEKYLEETIQSVLNQTYDNVEYIIIDGGSTDGTLDIIKKYDQAIDYWISERDRGIYDAMNKGIDLATGEWINFMNGGDGFYSKDVLQKIFQNNMYRDYKVLYGDVQTDYGDYKFILKAGSLSNIYKAMQFSHQSTFFKASYHKLNKYNLNYKLSADFLNLISLYSIEKNSFYYLNILVSKVSSDGVSDKYITSSIIECWKAIREVKVDSLKINVYYLLQISKQYIKTKLLPRPVLEIYRKVKFKAK